MAFGGYVDRVARIDLNSGSVSYEPLNRDDVRKYVGGRGLGVKYVFDNGPSVDALSPDNLLGFVSGPLNGTDTNMSGRMAIVTKSPLTGTVTDSHHGGWSGARMKWAGLDALLFKGKAKKPVYAYVENGNVELRDAGDLWGKGVHETVKTLLARHGDDTSVIAIGPGGENLVKYAGLINENDRASGRGGTGTVAGSKRLKAVVIKANKKTAPKPADRDAYRQAHRDALAHISDDASILKPRSGGLSVLGTNSLMNLANVMGALPTRNSQLSAYPRASETAGEFVKEHILVDDPTCHACPVACKKEVETPEGPYHVHMESVEYESAWSLGANCENPDINAISFMIDLCNDYGIDTIEVGNVISMAMEASEKELIRERIDWGNADQMIELLRQITFREGIGDTLAEGAAAAAAKIGDPSMAMSVKGQSIPAYDPRGMKGMGLGYATSNRGACHLRGYTVASEVLGIPYKTDPQAWEGKAEVAKLLQDLLAFSDSLDLCKFSSFGEKPEDYVAQYSAVVGEPMSVTDALTIGERVYNLERHYNNLAGLGEGSDYLPERFLKEPSTAQGSLGQVCELDLMLPQYYAVRGWVNGVVPPEKLKELAIP